MAFLISDIFSPTYFILRKISLDEVTFKAECRLITESNRRLIVFFSLFLCFHIIVQRSWWQRAAKKKKKSQGPHFDTPDLNI